MGEYPINNKKWRKRIFNDGFIFCSVVLLAEAITLLAYIISGTFEGSYVFYICKNLIAPTVFNYSFLIICLVICSKKNYSDKVLNNLAVMSISIPACFTAIIHFIYPEISLCFTIPLFLSTIFADRKILDRLFVLFPVATVIAYILCVVNSGLSVSEVTIEYVITFVILICTIIASRVTLNANIEKLEKVSEMYNKNKKINKLLKLDALTGLYNKVSFISELENIIYSSSCDDIYVAMIDLDDFKKINDKYGHVVGDNVILALSSELLEITKKSDRIITSRYGGEEFAILFHDMKKEKIEKLLNVIKKRFVNKCVEYNATFSCGVARYNDVESSEELIDAADKLMYKVKQSGKNRIIF